MSAFGYAARSAAEEWWWAAALACFASFIAIALVQRFDSRRLGDESAWAKPMKFAISIAVHFATAALAVRCLGSARADGAVMRWTAVASILAAAFEVAYIAFQGARRQQSHFNTTTRFHTAMWRLMAFAALLVLLPFPVIGIAALLDDGPPWAAPVRLGVSAGLLSAAILTPVVGFRIGANMGHFIGPAPTEDVRLPLVGWSLRGADLRPAHFMALHAAQAIPLAALAATATLPSSAASLATATWALLWIVATWWLFRTALQGRSLQAALLGMIRFSAAGGTAPAPRRSGRAGRP